MEKSEGSEGEEVGVGERKRRERRMKERTSESEKHILSGVFYGCIFGCSYSLNIVNIGTIKVTVHHFFRIQ